MNLQLRLVTLASATLSLTCARPLAPGPAAPGAASSPATAADDDGSVGALPKRPAPAPVKDHPELRPLTLLARDASDGFETLVASTGEEVSCPGQPAGAAEVRIEGGADPRRPWSVLFDYLSRAASINFPTGGKLVVRRPLPAAGERQVAHVMLSPACNGGAQHYRFALPDADPKAKDPRAPATWANAFDQQVNNLTAWGRFATARAHALYPEPPPGKLLTPESKPAPETTKTRTSKTSKTAKKPAPKPATNPAAKPIIAPAPRAGVTAPPRRNSSDLAQLMETTTGMTSLQETLQTDRWLVPGAEEPATVPLAEVKPPPLEAHPFAAMLTALGRPVPVEPLAAATPAGFYFVRFKSLADLFRLRDRLDTGLTSALAALDERFADYDVSGRYEAELGVGQGPLTRMLGPSVVEDLAIVGSDPYLREGSDVTLVFRVKAAPAFEAALGATLAVHGAAHGGLSASVVERSGVPIQVSRSADGVVRRHRASVGGFELVSNSLGAIERVVATIKGAAPRLADEPDFRYMMARDAAVPADVLAFMSDRFVNEVIGPRQKILEARRQVALAELSRPGFAALLHGWIFGAAPAGADALVASGLLKREELAHAGGEKIAWQPGQAARSSWGRVGALTPLIDLPAPAKVTPSERDAYSMFVSGYQSYWRAYVDPIAVRISLGAGAAGPVGFDLRILPIISGTDYSKVSRTVGRARVGLGDGRHGARSALGIGPDAELRHLLSHSLQELPLVGALRVDWLGDWALVGIDDAARPRHPTPEAFVAMNSTERWLSSLVELPLYAGVEIHSRGAAAAFLAGARQMIEQAAPGVIDWREAGKHRDVPFVAIRAAAGSDESKSAWHDLALYYAFCKSSLVLSLGEAALRRRIDECVDGRAPRPIAPAKNGGGEAPQWIVEADLRERGPLWWLLATLASEQTGFGRTTLDPRASLYGLSLGAAEAVLRGAPGLPPPAARLLARDVLGAAPLTPEGHDYTLAPDGLHDPVRGLLYPHAQAAIFDLLASDDSPFVRLLRTVGHARSEVSFDDEPAVAKNDPARSLHVRLRLGAAR